MAPSPSLSATDSQLDKLLTDLVQRIADVRHSIVLSEDGLVVSKSTAFPREDADRLAATSSGLMSLGRGVCTEFGGTVVHQTLLEMDCGYLILTSAGLGTCLAVITTQRADVGVVAYEMNMLIKKIGDHLSAAPRGQAADAVDTADNGD